MALSTAGIPSLFVLASFLIPVALASSCGNGLMPGRSCTEIGCVNGLSWAFSAPLRESGTYVVRLELDGTVVTCQATLPFSGCTGDNPCSSADVVLEQSGCALPASDHSLGGLHILSTPTMIGVTIQRDDVEIVQAAITPEYMRVQPNGEGCEPVCEQASATLTIP